MGMIIARMIPNTARGTPSSEKLPKRDKTEDPAGVAKRASTGDRRGLAEPEREPSEGATLAPATGAICDGAAMNTGKRASRRPFAGSLSKEFSDPQE